jgi:hypothetical protein
VTAETRRFSLGARLIERNGKVGYLVARREERCAGNRYGRGITWPQALQVRCASLSKKRA